MKTLLTALLMVSTGFADACSPVVHVWTENTPKPEIVVEGTVVEESSEGMWERTLIVRPARMLRGKWNADVSVAVSCGAGSPLVGENAVVARMGSEKEWILIPSWQEQEFRDYLRKKF